MSFASTLKRLFIKVGSSPIFLLEVDHGKIVHISGNKPVKFIKECQSVIDQNQVKKGFIYAVRSEHGKARIKMSSDISKEVAQRIRNLWSFHS